MQIEADSIAVINLHPPSQIFLVLQSLLAHNSKPSMPKTVLITGLVQVPVIRDLLTAVQVLARRNWPCIGPYVSF